MPMAVFCAPGMGWGRKPRLSIFLQTRSISAGVACAFMTINTVYEPFQGLNLSVYRGTRRGRCGEGLALRRSLAESLRRRLREICGIRRWVRSNGSVPRQVSSRRQPRASFSGPETVPLASKIAGAEIAAVARVMREHLREGPVHLLEAGAAQDDGRDFFGAHLCCREPDFERRWRFRRGSRSRFAVEIGERLRDPSARWKRGARERVRARRR